MYLLCSVCVPVAQLIVHPFADQNGVGFDSHLGQGFFLTICVSDAKIILPPFRAGDAIYDCIA